MDMNRGEIERELDVCLLTDDETTQDWSKFNNPFPEFVVVP